MNKFNQFCSRMMLLAVFAVMSFSVSGQVLTVKGKVSSASETLPGVSVLVKGTKNGTTTDLDGSFTLQAKQGDVLQISFIGFATQDVPAASEVTVLLLPDAFSLDVAVVTALGLKRDEKSLGYAVSRISSEDLLKSGSGNFATSLYGKASGVRIQAAPGGATSAVSINIRGLNSITGSSQPLIIIDGVPVRNGEANNDGYWTDQRVNSNGLVDINPEDIGDLTILKGASASALYGSEAANGVVLITTKSGKGQKGLGINFNMTYSFDKAAYMPEYQNVFGPGATPESRSGAWLTGNGWKKETVNGVEYDRLQYETTQNFGPRFDGREVVDWDGSVRNYNPSTNRWNELFQTGFSQSYNLAVVQGNEKSNMRFSYTYVDNKGVQKESENKKHNFNFVGSTTLSKNVKIDYTANYMRQSITNRPYRMNRVTNSFSGMFSTFDDTKSMYDRTVTSLGYLNVGPGAQTPTPDEAFIVRPAAYGLMEEYFWNIRKKRREELVGRLLASVTPTITITDYLTLRGRISTDLTTNTIENMESNNKPLSIGNSGAYDISNDRYEIYYGDVLLMFDKMVTDKVKLTANVGYQGRVEQFHKSNSYTDGGLTVENWFHLNASRLDSRGGMSKSSFLKQAFLGTVGVGYDNYLFLEATARQEQSSTLPEGSNKFFYPSVNASFVFTEALKDKMPSWIDFGKIRASYGIVGNAPAIYKANNAYNQSSLNGSIMNQRPNNLGNNNIKPEEKHEVEFGIEAKFLQNRLGLEATYYNNITKDQILDASTPMSSGASSMLVNVGELQNRGWEFMLYGTPIRTRDFTWDLRANISFNKNTVNKLMPGLTELEHRSIDGAVRVVSRVGEPMGDIYAHVPKTDDKGNKIVGDDGLYAMDRDNWVKVGNAMPKAVGGGATTLRWKNIAFDAAIDYRIGGDIMNTPYQYMMGRGTLIQSMQWRDAENGGMSYYIDANKQKVALTGNNAPSGATVRDDGLILQGVNVNGEANTTIVASPTYYNETYNWGASGAVNYTNSIFTNTYVKVRELSLTYTLPQTIASKIACKNLSVSAFGRNLFYIYKNLPAFDAEATDATNWISQVEIGGSTATTRTFGFSIRASF